MFQFAPVSDRIRHIRERKDVFTGGKYMTLNAERTKIYTDYCKMHDNEYPLLKRAGALYAWCATKAANVFDEDIFVGTPGPDPQSLSPLCGMGLRLDSRRGRRHGRAVPSGLADGRFHPHVRRAAGDLPGGLGLLER